MATIRKRGDAWEVDYRINGKRYKKVVGKNKRFAELHLKEIEVKIAKNDLGFLQKDSDIKKLFDEFIKYSETNHSPNTVKRYKAIINNFSSFLGKSSYIKKISQLNPKNFEDYKHYRKKQGAKDKTLNIELQTVRSMFNLARKWGYCKDNPTEGVKCLKIDKNRERRFLTKEECEKLLKNCGEELYPVFFTFLSTGMRRGELLNLEWRDVDFERQKIRIREKEEWAPKTAERDIPMSNKLVEVFKKMKQNSKGKLVFSDQKGQQIEKNRLRKQLIKITKKCEFPDVTKLHTLRHTFASHLVMKGIDLPTVKKLMGHSDIDTTMIYAHLAESHVDKAVERLDF
ncbi:MAG: tyrosine-type recombinase/integrase [Candidatus Zapsychrus exili]|nr:tyrosine-type recombinase/integrase [Candidatus Zapsychrus exili]